LSTFTAGKPIWFTAASGKTFFCRGGNGEPDSARVRIREWTDTFDPGSARRTGSGMSERLLADLTRIGEVAVQITRLGSEFSQATTLAQGYAPDLGSPQLAGVLNTFATGWAIHRQRLIDDLSQQAELAQTAVRSYHGTDEQLAAALGRQEAAS
jgi:hypothetical protein